MFMVQVTIDRYQVIITAPILEVSLVWPCVIYIVADLYVLAIKLQRHFTFPPHIGDIVQYPDIHGHSFIGRIAAGHNICLVRTRYKIIAYYNICCTPTLVLTG